MTILIQTISLIAAILADNPLKPLAYLDPGSGSFIFQLILASLLGAAIVVRAYWRRIVGFFKGSSADDSQDEEE